MSILVLLFSVLTAPAATASDSGYAISDTSEYERIYWQFREAPLGKRGWDSTCVKIAEDYQKFIAQYPKSDLIDDAKLRIAEFYQLAELTGKAKPWLMDVIQNHPDADYYSIIKHGANGEKTAAWALFWRGYWWKEAKYLQLIIKNYPNSPEAVEQAKKVLKSWSMSE